MKASAAAPLHGGNRLPFARQPTARMVTAVAVLHRTGKITERDLEISVGAWGSNEDVGGNRLLRAMRARGVKVLRPRLGYFLIDGRVKPRVALTNRQRAVWFMAAEKHHTGGIAVWEAYAAARTSGYDNPTTALARLCVALQKSGHEVVLQRGVICEICGKLYGGEK